MPPLRIFLALSVVVFSGLCALYLVVFPTEKLRYRLTLDVDVDGVTRSGTGVVEFSYQPPPNWLIGFGAGTKFMGKMRGYAITVDLGERGLLFVVDRIPFLLDRQSDRLALPKATSLNMLPFAAYNLPVSQSPSSGLAAARDLRLKRGAVDLSPEVLPMIVRFEDTGHQTKLEELDPRDLAAVYGQGVKLLHSRFEFTDDPVSPLPQSWPRWLAKARPPNQFVFRNSQTLFYDAIEPTAFKGRSQ